MLTSGLSEKWWNAPSPSGNAIKLSGRTFLAPHWGSCPKGLCKRTGFLGVNRRENPVRRHFERSEMRGLRSGIAFAASPGGEVSRYDATSDCICMSIESPLNRDTQYWETSDARIVISSETRNFPFALGRSMAGNPNGKPAIKRLLGIAFLLCLRRY